MKKNYQVGQTLVLCPSIAANRREPREVTITKVGREWVYFEGHGAVESRFNIQTGAVDGKGYASPGVIWDSWDALNAETRRKTLQRDLRHLLQVGGAYSLEQLQGAFDALQGGAEVGSTTQPAVPEGYQLVPVEPTAAMREAFHTSYERYEDGIGECPDSQWKAMLRAAKEGS